MNTKLDFKKNDLQLYNSLLKQTHCCKHPTLEITVLKLYKPQLLLLSLIFLLFFYFIDSIETITIITAALLSIITIMFSILILLALCMYFKKNKRSPTQRQDSPPVGLQQIVLPSRSNTVVPPRTCNYNFPIQETSSS